MPIPIDRRQLGDCLGIGSQNVYDGAQSPGVRGG